MDKVDCLVIGAGVVGLAVARALARAGREVVIVEAAQAIGTGTSSRNSEVIHAGIYYPQGSRKAALCVAGNRALYAYCAERGVAHRRCGKLIVATADAQVAELQAIEARAIANGVTDLRWLSAAEAQAMEPAVRCVRALFSPSTGIVDSHGLMLALLGEAEQHGAMLALDSPVLSGRVTPEGIIVRTGTRSDTDRGMDGGMELLAHHVINSAGLQAQTVAASIEGFPAAQVPPCFYAKGNYYSLAGRSPFSHLVYPVPEPGGLGVHVTLDLAGQARFGPDVEWVNEIDYRVDPARAQRFYAAVRAYWPELPDDALLPAYSGIRPKLGPAGSPESSADFRIEDAATHGVPGLIHLFGIESPGLTSALVIGETVARSVLTSGR
ncbi:MAG: NAD(P)/FAD-dependent oxidoreductase [Betaproteobacteria bacterium]|nr:NAD(P)/FAD-dependent oxidoreductase [Betaproteobacteria bacterium]